MGLFGGNYVDKRTKLDGGFEVYDEKMALNMKKNAERIEKKNREWDRQQAKKKADEKARKAKRAAEKKAIEEAKKAEKKAKSNGKVEKKSSWW